ncbi:UNVERIFIED_CONTAM: hypothetical protein GTU68_026267, partial [Idotea baltica]|nr:hypothetical protein [Idotea baltica]
GQLVINRYTIIGQPVAQSVSPAIHHLFGELTQRRIHYTRTEATKESFAQIVKDWQESGGKGCNVTAPFKELAATVCHRLNDSAIMAEAVNTIEIHRDGLLVGHNTDGMGLLADIEKNKRVSVANKRVLILGAGGATRGAMGPLLAANPACLHIANRSLDKAEALANKFAANGPTAYSNYEELNELESFDIIINATSMGFDNSAPPIPTSIFHADTFAYDMMYKAEQTPFLALCESFGVKHYANGFGMLVEQAADAYLIWEGVRPKTRKIYLATDEIAQGGLNQAASA